MKKLFLILTLAALLVFLVACGDEKPESDAASTAAPVATLTPGAGASADSAETLVIPTATTADSREDLVVPPVTVPAGEDSSQDLSNP